MSKVNVEALKAQSRGLRGSIAPELDDPASARVSDESAALLKFHGTYQQEDRDERKAARDGGAEKPWSFMVRVKATGGRVPAPLWSAVDDLAERHGNGTIRVTTRQGLQLHGVRKPDLKPVIADIVANLGSTLATCGDVVRNVVAPAWPYAHPAYAAARDAAAAISAEFAPRTGAYLEIWQDGQAVHEAGGEDEPIYGATYLPRKFKIAVTVPGDNSVDLYTNDVGVVPVFADDGTLVAYNLAAGGGLGMTHGKTTTFPRLADHLGLVAPERLLDAVRAIVVVQRDYGDRTDRKHARLKYLIADRGLGWFRSEVEREAGFALQPWRELPAWDDPAKFGWHAQGEGGWFLGLYVASGRIKDEGERRLKSALRAIADRGYDLVATPGQQVLVVDVPAGERETIDALLQEHGVEPPLSVPALRTRALACPALPTCGLALAESERALPAILAAIEAELAAAGLPGETIAIRMTGCPNGCTRPYMAEIGIVGQSADRYQLYLGGSPASTRLAKPWREKVRSWEIAPLLAPLFVAFRNDRRVGESFGDWAARDVLAEVVL
ncbi:sulfite reductase subunit beta [Vulcanimicrobium alpinum]|uniref:Sulfite reductase subunit beta n=1 Tax=Vulcanimicrobium alpinum TaxID=3016050 RepID=A0AAN1Y0U8_UNVUL|nr:NADPH-dependent assimilatory sulfite reductase hemoprotein subunit [Vulcanimicrobium alpinum]BDE08107.1 sulfite reductase subunit beta [Vulcanimicrobium alpinum]